jgi:hypothetical protein
VLVADGQLVRFTDVGGGPGDVIRDEISRWSEAEHLTVSRSGASVALSSESEVRLFDVANRTTKTMYQSAPGSKIESVYFGPSPNDLLVISTDCTGVAKCVVKVDAVGGGVLKPVARVEVEDLISGEIDGCVIRRRASSGRGRG